MSTFYYLVCDKHRIVSQVIGGRSFPHRWWSNDDGELEAFLEAHAGCKPNPRLVSEQEDESFEYDTLRDAPVTHDPSQTA